MFCGLLLSSSNLKKGDSADVKPLVAQKTDLNIRVVSDNGRGSADLTYFLDKEYDDLVLYVPQLIAHQDMTRQHVKLTCCQIGVTNINTRKTENCTLQVSKLVTAEYSKCMDSLPSYIELKKQYKGLVSTYTGALSSEDVLLHLGRQSASSQLNLHLEFLVKFDSPSPHHPVLFKSTPSPNQMAASSWQYVIHNILPTEHLSYTFTLGSSLPIEGVVASPLQNELEWKYVGSDEFRYNVVHVTCEMKSDVDVSQSHPCSCGFSVIFTPGILSDCCMCGVTSVNGVLKRSNTHPAANNPIQQQPKEKWDAIMMLNTTFSRDQLPLHIQQNQVYPSEFLFIIDCSGSMSGSNIQSAADMLIMCVKSLPSGCYFNVIAFGSHFRQLFHASEKYSKHTVERAVAFANQLQATLGGTDLLPPLQWIFKKPHCDNLPRQIFIITDGGVTNTQQVLNTVKKNRHQARYE